jgi:hypothetical protein
MPLAAGDDVIIVKGTAIDVRDRAIFKKIGAARRTKIPVMVIPQS